MSLFDGDLFRGMAGLGELPSTAHPIAELQRYRVVWPELTSAEHLRSGAVTHFTLSPQAAQGAMAPGTRRVERREFVYYGADGTRKGNQYLTRLIEAAVPPRPELVAPRPSSPGEKLKEIWDIWTFQSHGGGYESLTPMFVYAVLGVSGLTYFVIRKVRRRKRKRMTANRRRRTSRRRR